MAPAAFSFEQAMPTPIIKTNAETKLAPRITDLPRPSGAVGSIGKPARGRNLRTSGSLFRTSDVRVGREVESPGNAGRIRVAPTLLSPGS